MTKPTTNMITHLGASLASIIETLLTTGGGSGSGDMTKAVYDTNNDGKVNTAHVAESVQWAGVQNKPTEYQPATHTHTIADVSMLATSLAGKQATLVSGSTLKTVNGESLLGSGNLTVSGGGGSTGVINVRDAGADNTGVTDCTTIVQTLINSNNTGKGFSLYFPPGKYRFNGQLTCTLDNATSFTMTGAGSEVSVLYFPNGSGIAITYTDTYWAPSPKGNSFGMAGLTLSTGTQGTGTAIQINGNTFEGRPAQATKFSDVGVRGETGGHMWSIGFDLASTSAGHFTNCYVYGANGNTVGTGILIRNTNTGPTTTTDPVEFVIANTRLFFLNRGVHCLHNDIEGVHIANSIIVYVWKGVEWTSNTAESALQICNSHIASTYRGIHIKNVFDTTISNNSFFTANNPNDWRGLEMDYCAGTVTGNVFAGCQLTSNVCLSVANSFSVDGAWGAFMGTSINGNSFRYAPLGVALTPNVTGVWVGANNVYGADMTPWFDQTNGQNIFEKKSYQTSTVRTLSGAVEEIINVALPPYAFFERPGAGFIAVEGSVPNPDIIGYYDFANSTKTDARFIMRNRNGGALPAGTRRYSVAVYEYNRFEN